MGKCKILTDNRFGFRKQHSTEYTSVALLYHKISSAIDNNEKTEGLFIDFSKAFDTVNHQIFLGKLLHYGFRGVAFNWLEDYLNNKQILFSLMDFIHSIQISNVVPPRFHSWSSAFSNLHQ